MYSRAKPPAHQARADNRHFAKHTPPESRPRGPATPTALDHATHTPGGPTPGNGSSSSSGGGGTAGPADGPYQVAAGPVRSTLLQPRVAVALGVSKKWYPVLFLCRLVSIAPGVLFGLPNALRLLATLHLMYLDRILDGGALSKLGRGGGRRLVGDVGLRPGL